MLERLAGNDALKAELGTALRGGRLPHAVLLVGEPGCGAGFAARPFATVRTIVDAAVLDGHPTVGQQFVVRLHTRQPPFERMIVAGDLIPCSHITPQVEHGDRHAVGAVRSRRDSHRTQNQKGGSKQ